MDKEPEETVMPETLNLRDLDHQPILGIRIQAKAESSEGFKNFSMQSQSRLRNQNDSKENQKKIMIPDGVWSK